MVFCLLALEELGGPAAGHAAAIISTTVVLSVVAHGATADPLAGRYAGHLARHADQSAGAELPGIPERRLNPPHRQPWLTQADSSEGQAFCGRPGLLADGQVLIVPGPAGPQ